MDVSKHKGTPKSSILIGVSIINHPFFGVPLFLETPIWIYYRQYTHVSDYKENVYGFFRSSSLSCPSLKKKTGQEELKNTNQKVFLTKMTADHNILLQNTTGETGTIKKL